MCSTDISSVTPGKVYTQKELVLLENLIQEFHNNTILQKLKIGISFPTCAYSWNASLWKIDL